MTKPYLNHWPFKHTEEVILFWICSPFRNKYGNWTIRVIFKRQTNELVELYYPWGTLPLLNVGGIYKDGFYIDKAISNVSFEIILPKDIDYTIDACFKMPSYLYNFRNNSEYGKQQCCIFNLNNVTYYLPCLEIIRRVLCFYDFFLYRILEPFSFKNLIKREEKTPLGLDIFFTDEYPTSLLTKAAITHFVWLIHNEKAKYEWNSVYQSRFSCADNYSNSDQMINKSIPLKAGLPFDSRVKLYGKGIRQGNHLVILEITSISDLRPPIISINYDHPRMIKYLTDNSDSVNIKKTQRIKNSFDNIGLDASGESSVKTTSKIINELSQVMISYSITPCVRRIKKEAQLSKSQISYSEAGESNKSAVKKAIGTTQDWSCDGKIPPLEFKILELFKAEDTSNRGLENFTLCIKSIYQRYPDFNISLGTYYLPDGKAFSLYPNGSKRTYCLVEVNIPGNIPTYIIEIGREDNWSISTLFIKPTTTQAFKTIDNLISKFIDILVTCNGHWNFKMLNPGDDLLLNTAKHISGQNNYDWTTRIFEKII